MNIKEKIVYEIALEAHEEILVNIKKITPNGYNNIYWGKFSEKIGLLFKRNDIFFESNYDSGYGVEDVDEKDKKFSKHFREICKNTPSKDFLQNILDQNFQKKLLLESLNLMNIKECSENWTAMCSITNILRDYGHVGINKLTINTEITNKLMKIYQSSNEKLHANIFAQFLYNDFFFPTEFIEKDFKQLFNTSIGNDLTTYNNLYLSNKKNYIKFSHSLLQETLPIKNNTPSNNKKIKI